MVSVELYGLSVVMAVLAFILGYVVAWYVRGRRVDDEVERRKDAALEKSRDVIGGQVAEQLAPWIPGFPGRVSEAQFLGKPVDYIVFNGADDKEIDSVTFVEVKSGESGLSAQERHLRDAIQEGEVSWELVRIDRG